MKQVTVEEISGRSGVSASFSPFAGKGKVGKSIRIHSGRTYRSNRKIWVCKVEEACHKPNYFIELEKAQKKEREYLAYEDFLKDRTPKYITETKMLDKFYPNSSYIDAFEKTKSTLKPLVDKWITFKDKNKVDSTVRDIGRQSYKILDLSFDEFFKMFSAKKLKIDTENVKSTYDNKSLQNELFTISPFTQDSSNVWFIYPALFGLFAYFFPSLLSLFGSSNIIFTTYYNTFHLSFMAILFILSLLIARSQYKVIKPAELEFANDKSIAVKVEEDFIKLEKDLANSYSKFYRNCVLYYLNSSISFKEYQTLPNGEEKKEHRTRFTYSIIPELSEDFDNINKSFVDFCADIKNPTLKKTNKSNSKATENTQPSKKAEKPSVKENSGDLKNENWTKHDYLRAYNEELFDEMVTIILCFGVAKADGETTDAENKFLSDLPEMDSVIKIMKGYPAGSYKIKTFCQLLKKKLDEFELENVINNLFFIAEADGDISSDEVVLIEKYAEFMGIGKTKFNLIKDSKLDAHSDNKKASILADDPIIDADFSDIEFDD